jgi:hypothetical protein
MKSSRIKIGAVRPHQGVDLRIQPNLVEEIRITERAIQRSGLQPAPTGNQLRLMQLGLSFHQSSLSPGQALSEQLYGVKAVHGLIVAMIGVKMGGVMRPHFAIHADDDSAKATELRHGYVDRASRIAVPTALLNFPNVAAQRRELSRPLQPLVRRCDHRFLAFRTPTVS